MDSNDNTCTLQKPGERGVTKTFTYDGVYNYIDSTQQGVYDDSSFSLVESVLEGYNGKRFMLRDYLRIRANRLWKDPYHDGSAH